MKENYKEVKVSVYAGMSIFNLIKDCELSIKDEVISLDDKKYLSLYLGIINTKNNISNYLKEKNIRFNNLVTFKGLNQEDYIKIYNNYFIEIFDEINFNSIEQNFEFLLSKDIIKKFNKSNGHYVDKTISESNKTLVKTIK